MSLYTDAEGNLWSLPVPVIAHHATTTVFWIGDAHAAVQPIAGDEWQAAEGTGGEFLGGNGRNWQLISATVGVQGGWYRPTAPNGWSSVRNGSWTWTRESDGSFTLSDGVDVVADSPAVGSGLVGVASAGSFAVVNWTLDSESLGNKVYLSPDDVNAALILDKVTGDAIITYGSGTAEAERLGGSTSDPSGVYTSTPWGETHFNSGNPWGYTVAAVGSSGTASSTAYGAATYGGAFSLAVAFEGGNEFTARPSILRAAGTVGAVEGFYAPTGWQTLQSATNPAWTLQIDGSGAGEWRDGIDVVAYRDADASRLYDPAGQWFSTVYGAATYGDAGAAFEVVVGVQQRAVTQAGYWFGELTLNAGTNEVTGTAGPKFAAALPANAATLAVYPLAWSDGAGTVRPMQSGPIHWHP